ncbi:GTP pyrophosphokinase [Bombilactobacillus thymidiniphilus]|uniref:GTP pyrophosphokinase family protein n=1 Tax=Bombilactobacillus thymidiniphilus TaxID=2923363 RepID=A0ABY4PBV7_9LACO|nr:GTP pyrophosphokinase family protein [Bombilactobacillus thymidiniphilus]UQS83026.1 GTP pyrophosphokinase family protein [Bombilactobacillus thymidiniphilus]
MILERNNFMSMGQIENKLNHLSANSVVPNIKQLMNLYVLRRAAIKEIGTKLENLDDEYSTIHNHNPINLIEERLKSPASLFEKIKRKHLDYSLESINTEILDIAGIRVVTNYLDDILRIKNTLVSQDDVTLIKAKDYLNHPKSNGYRGIHLVVTVPVFLANQTHKAVPVEVQLRTSGMELWASLEHRLHYKNSSKKTTEHIQKLQEYSQKINDIEIGMQQIARDIQQ